MAGGSSRGLVPRCHPCLWSHRPRLPCHGPWLSLPRMRKRLEELPWDRQGWDPHAADSGRKSMSLLAGAHEAG